MVTNNLRALCGVNLSKIVQYYGARTVHVRGQEYDYITRSPFNTSYGAGRSLGTT